MTSRSNIDGGLFSPHLGMKFPFKIGQTILTIAPYFMLDWVNNWQGSVKENGRSGLNLKIDSHYVSLLRSEVGLHLQQTLRLKKGDLTFEESGSYVNRAPFNAKKVQAFYVGSISTFSLQLFSNHVENLGALRLSGRYTPCNLNTPFISLNYLGEFSTHLQLHTLALEMGTPF